MVYLRYLRENTTKIRENKRKLSIETVCAVDFRRVFKSRAQESTPGNGGDVPAESKGAGIRMNTAPPTQVQYSWFVRAQGYNKSKLCIIFPSFACDSNSLPIGDSSFHFITLNDA